MTREHASTRALVTVARLLLVFAIFTLAGCQCTRESQLTRTYSGTLTADLPVQNDGTHYETYTRRLPANAWIGVTLVSPDFDTYLIVQPPGGGPQLDNDDCDPSDSSRGSCVSFITEKRGTWTFVVNTHDRGETGDYTLSVETRRGDFDETHEVTVPAGPPPISHEHGVRTGAETP